MAATSINVQPVKGGSELHNTRGKELDYVRPELTPLNESWQIDTISNRLETIKENYKETTGQQMQQKATPIREGVVVIKEDTTMKDLQDFAQKAEQRFGIKAIQIHIHKDEGHQNGSEWKPNLHAHVVFDWTQANGKTCKLNRQDMAELQTLLSLSLKMERGQSSDAKHLNSIQFKNEREKEKALELSKEVKKLETVKDVKSAVSKTVERFKDVLGKSTNDKEKETLKTANLSLSKELNQVKSELSQAKVALVQEQNKSTWNAQRASKTESQLTNYKDYVKKIHTEIMKFGNVFNKEQREAIKASYPIISKVIESVKDQKQEVKESRSKGMKL